MKVCKQCGQVKAATYDNFGKGYKRKDGSYGLRAVCLSCRGASETLRDRVNKDKADARKERWRKAHPGNSWDKKNKEKANARKRAWAGRNKAQVKAQIARWSQANPGKVNARSVRRRTKKLLAQPTWANSNSINEFYTHAALMTRLTGVTHEVDHIDPLQNNLVCGLHVENNLRVVSREDNRSKSNKFQPYDIHNNTLETT